MSNFQKRLALRKEKYDRTISWQTKILSLFGEDEADPVAMCFRPLENGSVRVWKSYQSIMDMTDRDYSSSLDNYQGEDENKSRILTLAEARSVWKDQTSKVYYQDDQERIMFAVPAWKVYP